MMFEDTQFDKSFYRKKSKEALEYDAKEVLKKVNGVSYADISSFLEENPKYLPYNVSRERFATITIFIERDSHV